jgi:hypothetical protein
VPREVAGVVFYLEDEFPKPVPYRPFWTAAWMEQISTDHPVIAAKLEAMFEERDFSQVLTDPVIP